MENLQEYQCPCCGGAIVFDSAVQKMKCPFCKTEFEMETLQGYNEELSSEPEEQMNWDTGAGGAWQEGEQSGLRTYVCKSCGGEIAGDDTLAASSCPFCGSPVVMAGQFSGDLRPDYVIPFQLDKKAAVDGLKKHLEGKLLLPKAFKVQNRIDEIKAVYVPFWLFEADADVSIRFRAAITRTWSDRNYLYTETRHYMLQRDGHIGFWHVPVNGSSKVADDLMESIEPFDFSDAVPFKAAYLAGYMADRYDITAEESVERANKRVKRSAEEAFAATAAGYTSVTPEHSSVQLHRGTAKYALYPVWIFHTTWNKKPYLFAMNGQTGKFAGDLPIDHTAAKLWTAALWLIYSAAVFGVAKLVWLIR